MTTIIQPAVNGETCESFAYYTPSAAPVCGRPADIVATYQDAFGAQHSIAQCADHRTFDTADPRRDPAVKARAVKAAARVFADSDDADRLAF